MHAVTLPSGVKHARIPTNALEASRRSEPSQGWLRRPGRWAPSADTPGLSRISALIIENRRHGIWIALWSLVGWIGTALTPALAGQPFILMLLSPRALFVALASDSVSLLPFVLFGTLRLSITDASYYIVGRRLPRGIDRVPSTKSVSAWKRHLRRLGHNGDRLCSWFCARPRLAGAFLFLRPNGKYLAVAGAYGVHPWLAGVSAALGTATFLTAIHIGLGAMF